MTISALEWAVAATGCITLAGATWALLDSVAECRALSRRGVNGAFKAVAHAHVARDVVRIVAASISAVGGVWLLVLPDDLSPSALIAKHAWMFYGWLMCVNIAADRRMRVVLRVAWMPRD